MSLHYRAGSPPEGSAQLFEVVDSSQELDFRDGIGDKDAGQDKEVQDHLL